MIPASISMPATADEELADLRGVDSAYGVGDSMTTIEAWVRGH